MKTENLVLLPATEQGTPAGNYDGSSTSFNGTKQKAVAYYKSTNTSQTVRFRADEFVGTVVVQATLDTDPQQDADWFDVYTFPGDSVNDGSTAITTDFTTVIAGNFTWMRVSINEFTSGSLGQITLTY